MKMITGLIETTTGEIFFDGIPIRGDLLSFKQRMGYVPEEPYLYSHLSGLEYLTMVGQLRDLSPKPAAQRIDGLLRLLSLHDDRHVPMSSYSKGMRQKILLSAALLHNPDLILLDEPFSGAGCNLSLDIARLDPGIGGAGKSSAVQFTRIGDGGAGLLPRGDFAPWKGSSRRFYRAATHADGTAHLGRDFLAACSRARHRHRFPRNSRSDWSATGQSTALSYHVPK